MALQPNRRLGPYEILSAVGAGGMGEVYRARDTRLDRIVAIKILPDHLADRTELRERFEREARTVASLNHSHICTLHDIGRQDRTDYLVMEYLEGETLAQRLTKGPLPLDQVLRYAIEIADALDKAPEQLEGKEVDARTDIFAFGTVVYEMATGKKAFEGKSQASLIVKILETDPPPISSLQPMTPPALESVVKTCLAKDPDDRWQTARDLTRELKWASEGSDNRDRVASVAKAKGTRPGLP